MSDSFTEEVSPYPGLRPFQAYDAEYFFGRDAQTADIVERLEAKRFVAVIGGSGSGKSSLVLAGAIPRLRTFAIDEAGDFWISVVSTPGTNHVEGDSPIQRLARKFSAELADTETPGARLSQCAELLRTENGLSKLVERFGRDLRDSRGVDLSRTDVQVNFLFLIDQFEELFHPSNFRTPIAGDCEALVNRIVEQFKAPHPQVCVALTMRSEHLNDCPLYADLPDAINAAFYLVKRLDGEQLQQAIELPAMRFLRKGISRERRALRLATQEGRASSRQEWPAEVLFEKGLVERLLRDSKAVLAQQDHADHLPLLQHLLFWIWAAASARCQGAPIPHAITLSDLYNAVQPENGGLAKPLDENTNALTACLENRCESIFARYPDRQARWQEVFKSLAFKEPNTGTYTQQRAGMSELFTRQQIQLNSVDQLETDLAPWLAPHGYLFWDTDSRTIKVAHETLIRRWERFRKWIDEQDIQFQVYLRLLEDATRWQAAGRDEWLLSTRDSLRRLEDAKLPEALRDRELIDRFGRLLGMHRDRQRLGVDSSTAFAFLQLSQENRDKRTRERDAALERERLNEQAMAQARRDADVAKAKTAEAEAIAAAVVAKADVERAESQAMAAAGLARASAEREKTARAKLKLQWTLGVVIAIAYIGISEWMLSQIERTFHRSNLLASETQVTAQTDHQPAEHAQLPLRNTLMGSYYFARGRKQWVGPAGFLPLSVLYAGRIDRLENAQLLGEARNIASLRSVLQNAVWTGSPQGKPMAWKRSGCSRPTYYPLLENPAFYPLHETKENRGLVTSENRSGAIDIYTGIQLDGCKINITNLLLTTPRDEPVRVGISADLSNIVLDFPTYLQFYAVLWDNPGRVESRFRVRVNKGEDGLPSLAGTKQRGGGKDDERIVPLKSVRTRFGTDVTLGANALRLFQLEPTPTDTAIAAGRRMDKPLANGICQKFATAQQNALEKMEVKRQKQQKQQKQQKPPGQPGQPEQLWELSAATGENRTYCLQVRMAPGEYKTFLGTLYGFRSAAHAQDETKHLPLLGGILLGDTAPTELRMETDEGWLAFRDSKERWRTLPWSLDVWRGLAKTVFIPGKADERLDEGKQFRLPYRLIIGTDRTPDDDALKNSLP